MAIPQAGTIMFEIRGPIARSDLPGLTERVCVLLARERPTTAICDVASVDADAVTIDALARLTLATRRHGCQIRLIRASQALLDLVGFMGLSDVISG